MKRLNNDALHLLERKLGATGVMESISQYWSSINPLKPKGREREKRKLGE
jgi:hypothetical protein